MGHTIGLVPSVPRRRGSRQRRFVVCGDNPLAYRLVNELVTRFGAEVTVVLPNSKRNQGPRMAQLPGTRLIEAAQLDDAALRAAGIVEARALALVGQDDVGNIHAALRANDLNPDLRLVIRMYNTSLGFRIRTLFADCAVLSDSAMAAPSFVAAALGEVAPSHVRLPGRTLYVAHREDVPPARVVCGLADTTGGIRRMLPADQENANLVLATADGPPVDPLAQHGSRGRFWRRIRFLLRANLVRLVLGLVSLIVIGLILMATVGHRGFGLALYETLLDAAGDAVPDDTGKLSAFGKFTQLMVTLAGLALIPVATAAVVDGLVRARLSDPAPDPERLADHVVVVGLGNVGTRVVTQLHDLGVPVVCVEPDENARGVQTARRLGVPVVIADATREETLRSASVANARALLLLTSSDVVNLEAALQGRALRDDLRVVLRLFDDDLAERVERSLGFAISRSVSRLAAGAFAAAVVERQVIGTMSIGRSVLLIGDVPVAAGAPLAGQPLGVANEPGEARVIAVRRRTADELDWSPRPGEQLAPGDRLTVVATRGGLGRLLARSIAPVPQPEAG